MLRFIRSRENFLPSSCFSKYYISESEDFPKDKRTTLIQLEYERIYFQKKIPFKTSNVNLSSLQNIPNTVIQMKMLRELVAPALIVL